MGRRTLVLFIALILAGVSAVSVFLWLSNVEDEAAERFTEIEVFRATQFIDVGTEGEIARDFIESSTALSSILDLDTANVLVCSGVLERDRTSSNQGICDQKEQNLNFLNEKVAAGPISAGQLITTDLFVTAAELNTVFLSEDIAQGKVAISFRPGDDAAVGGFIRPGDRINLIASAGVELSQIIDLVSDPDLRDLIIDLGIGQQPEEEPPVGQEEGEEEADPITQFVNTLPPSIQFTQTVLQDIEVLAFGPDTRLAPLGTGLEPQGTQIIVVEVTSEQAELIQFAKENTSIALTLLPKDAPYTQFASRGVVVDDLFDLLSRIEEQLQSVGAQLGS